MFAHDCISVLNHKLIITVVQLCRGLCGLALPDQGAARDQGTGLVRSGDQQSSHHDSLRPHVPGAAGGHQSRPHLLHTQDQAQVSGTFRKQVPAKGHYL